MNRTYEEFKKDSSANGSWPATKEYCYESGKREIAKAVSFLIDQGVSLKQLKGAIEQI